MAGAQVSVILRKIIPEDFFAIKSGHVAFCRTIYKESFCFVGMDVFVAL